jgi:hypothetical protein
MAGPDPRRLRLDDVELLPEQTSDDVEAPGDVAAATDPAAVLRRYLEDKPPHHGD